MLWTWILNMNPDKKNWENICILCYNHWNWNFSNCTQKDFSLDPVYFVAFLQLFFFCSLISHGGMHLNLLSTLESYTSPQRSVMCWSAGAHLHQRKCLGLRGKGSLEAVIHSADDLPSSFHAPRFHILWKNHSLQRL